MWLLVLLCLVGACFGARAFFTFIGLLFALPLIAAALLAGWLVFLA